ncbi:MAG: hypothetical protein LUD12_16195 [Lachnospiraceae bacterium]|nr:hypothetical protein [Lachnospiraceae bacterium]
MIRTKNMVNKTANPVLPVSLSMAENQDSVRRKWKMLLIQMRLERMPGQKISRRGGFFYPEIFSKLKVMISK